MSDPSAYRACMTTSDFGVSVGEVVEVASGPLPLPFGLTPGFQVRVIRREEGGAVVEREGREWRLADSHLQPRRSIRSPRITPRPLSPTPCTGLRAGERVRRPALAGRQVGVMTR